MEPTSILLGFCIGSALVVFILIIAMFGLINQLFSLVINWAVKNIPPFLDNLFSLTGEISTSIKSLTDEQKEQLTEIAAVSVGSIAALALYMQDDKSGESKEMSRHIMGTIIENISDNDKKEKTMPIEGKKEKTSDNGVLHGEVVLAPRSPNTYFEERHQFKVFLCHAKEDTHIAKILRDKLAQYDYDVWLDDNNLMPGYFWETEIQRAVQTSDIFLVCVSSSWIKRPGYIQKELRIALEEAQKKPEGSIFILPTRFEDCEVPASLRNLQYLDLFKDSPRSFMRLIKTLDLVKTTKFTM